MANRSIGQHMAKSKAASRYLATKLPFRKGEVLSQYHHIFITSRTAVEAVDLPRQPEHEADTH